MVGAGFCPPASGAVWERRRLAGSSAKLTPMPPGGHTVNEPGNPSTNPPDEALSTVVSIAGKTKVGDLDYKTAALLCYVPVCLVNLIASIVFLNSEPRESRFVRFHAMQSLIMSIAVIAV